MATLAPPGSDVAACDIVVVGTWTPAASALHTVVRVAAAAAASLEPAGLAITARTSTPGTANADSAVRIIGTWHPGSPIVSRPGLSQRSEMQTAREAAAHASAAAALARSIGGEAAQPARARHDAYCMQATVFALAHCHDPASSAPLLGIYPTSCIFTFFSFGCPLRPRILRQNCAQCVM